MKTLYVAKQGDCLSSIAFEHGFFWDTLWTLPENAELKAARGNPNVLKPGDRLTIPQLRSRSEQCNTEERHRFRRKGVPARLRIRFVVDQEPLGAQPYRLTIDGRTMPEGSLDGDGLLDVFVPPNAREATVVVGEGTGALEYHCQLGEVDPVETLPGLQQRLNNLGFRCEYEPELGASTRTALERFQASISAQVTGEADAATREALVEEHGC